MSLKHCVETFRSLLLETRHGEDLPIMDVYESGGFGGREANLCRAVTSLRLAINIVGGQKS